MFEKLKDELAEAKREIENLKEVQSIITESNKEEAEFTRLAAFEARVKGITDDDVIKLFCEHRKRCGFDAKTCASIAAAVLALVRGE